MNQKNQKSDRKCFLSLAFVNLCLVTMLLLPGVCGKGCAAASERDWGMIYYKSVYPSLAMDYKMPEGLKICVIDKREYGVILDRKRKEAIFVFINNDYRKTFKIPEKIKGYPVTEVCGITDKYRSMFGFDGTCSEKIIIPRYVKRFNVYRAPNLKKYVVSAKNKHFKAEKGILYKKVPYGSGTTWALQKYPAADTSGTIIIEKKVRIIEKGAFFGCSMKKVILPAGLRKIGRFAFGECRYLKEARLPKALKKLEQGAFYDCESLKSIAIPHKIKEIKPYVFAYCSKLKTAVLPDHIKKFGTSSFNGCRKLKIKLPKQLKTLGRLALCGNESIPTLKLPDGLKKIGSYAFYTSYIYEIEVPPSVKELKETSFYRSKQKSADYGCPLLYVQFGSKAHQYARDYGWDFEVKCEKDFTSPDGAFKARNGILYQKTVYDGKETWALYTFPSWKRKKSYKVPEGTIVISDHAFRYCNTLKKVTFPASLRSIGAYAFGEVYDLKDVVIPKNVEYIGYRAFCEMDGSLTIEEGTRLKNIEFDLTGADQLILPEGIETIKKLGGFMKTLDLPKGLLAIGPKALSCMEIKKLKLPETLKSIGDYGLSGCDELEELTLPEGIESIGSHAFYRTKITSLHIPASVKSLSAESFLKNVLAEDGYTRKDVQIKIYVKEGSFAHRFAVEHGLDYATERNAGKQAGLFGFCYHSRPSFSRIFEKRADAAFQICFRVIEWDSRAYVDQMIF